MRPGLRSRRLARGEAGQVQGMRRGVRDPGARGRRRPRRARRSLRVRRIRSPRVRRGGRPDAEAEVREEEGRGPVRALVPAAVGLRGLRRDDRRVAGGVAGRERRGEALAGPARRGPLRRAVRRLGVRVSLRRPVPRRDRHRRYVYVRHALSDPLPADAQGGIRQGQAPVDGPARPRGAGARRGVPAGDLPRGEGDGQPRRQGEEAEPRRLPRPGRPARRTKAGAARGSRSKRPGRIRAGPRSRDPARGSGTATPRG